MPRSFSIVLISSSTPADMIYEAVSSLLDPHASYLELFEPYCVPCVSCVNSSEDGIEAANKQVGDFHRLWHSFQKIPEGQRYEWKDYIAPWEETAIASAFTSPHYHPHDPTAHYAMELVLQLSNIP